MKNLTEVKEKTNDLRHSINTKDSDGNLLIIDIKLNDECKNGHQDFSITATGYRGNTKSAKNVMYCGCCHEEILKVMPNLKIFINLHSADYTGVPMYAVENGFYHLTKGFNNIKQNNPKFSDVFCQYYRINTGQFKELMQSESKLQYAIKLEKLGIINQWKKEAKEAIKFLEEITGKEFLIDSKTPYKPSEKLEIKIEEQKQDSGYYTPEMMQQRKEKVLNDIKQKQYDEIKADLDKEIKKSKNEYDVKKAVLDADLSIENFIYYSHSNEGAFNWMDSENPVTENEFNGFLEYLELTKPNLPNGIIFKIK